MKKHILAVFVSSSVLVLTACGGGDGDSTSVGVDDGIPKNNIVNPVVTTPTAYTATDMSATAGESVVMTYKMLGQDNKETRATALLFTPKTVAPAKGWPIVVWAHGTTGVADICAPSKSSMDPDVKSMINKLLSAGYVVVAPDYEGLGEPSGTEAHPYLNLKSEAFSITDAVVATRDYLTKQGKSVSKNWVTVGHSQGGHAALGAGEYQSRAQLDYKGTVAIAPASNLKTIFQAGAASVANLPAIQQVGTYTSLNTYAALITAGMQNPPNITLYGQVFESEAARIARTAESACSGTVSVNYYTEMWALATGYNTLNGYYPKTGFLDVPVIKNFLDNTSQPLKVKQTAPIIIYQGTNDTTVPRAITNILYAGASQAGNNIRYVTDDSETTKWTHTTSFSENIDDIVDDVKTLMPIQ